LLAEFVYIIIGNIFRLNEPNAHFATKSWLERIIVMGVKKAPGKITLRSPSKL